MAHLASRLIHVPPQTVSCANLLGCLAVQAHYDEQVLQDTEVDAPMANLHLHNLQVSLVSNAGLCALKQQLDFTALWAFTYTHA
jgi:hypothetical protein